MLLLGVRTVQEGNDLAAGTVRIGLESSTITGAGIAIYFVSSQSFVTLLRKV